MPKLAHTATVVLLLVPIVGITVISLTGIGAFSLSHSFVHMSATTFGLGLGTVLLATCWGVVSAWLVEACQFPGRRVFALALFLPFAFPPYLSAYVFADLIDDGGWLPVGIGVRNLPGACLVMSLVLYPYIYMLARASFARRSGSLLAAARLLGCTPATAFWRVALPVAQPAIALGGLLVFMETINDLAVAVDYGLRTLGYHVYDTWFNRGDRAAAAAVALVLLLTALGLALGENYSRKRQRQYQLQDRYFATSYTVVLTGHRALLAVVWCSALFGVAFVVPFFSLLSKVIYSSSAAWPAAGAALVDTLRIVGLVVGLGLLLAGMLHFGRPRTAPTAVLGTRIAQAGYALPGTIYALGALVVITWLANNVFQPLGINLAWVWISSSTLLVAMLAARYLVILAGALETGTAPVSPRLVAVARNAGKSTVGIIMQVYVPLLRPALLAGVLLLSVDILKELPLTLILRPFGTDTLAVQIFQYATDADLASAAPAAVGLVLLATLALGLGYKWLQPNSRPG